MNIIYYLAAAGILTLAVYKSRDLRRTPSASLRAFCLTLYSLGAAFLLLANGSRPVVDRVLGVTDIARWMGNSLTLVAACSVQIVLAHFTRETEAPPPRLRLRIGVLAAAITAMGVLILTDAAGAPDVPDFIDAYGQRPHIAAYLLIYLAYLGVAMIDALLLAWRYAPRAPQKYLRIGLRAVATGSATGLGYVSYKSAFVVLRLIHGPHIGIEGIIGPILGLLTSIQVIVGSTIGSWGPALEERILRWRSYHRMRPLWRALRDAFPEIVLHSSRADALYRRVIEIHDAQRLLRPYRDPAVGAAATAAARHAGLPEDLVAAHAEAAILHAALRAKHDGLPPHPAAAEAPIPPVPADLDADAAWLAQVARAFARSPLIRRAAATAEQTDRTQPERT